LEKELHLLILLEYLLYLAAVFRARHVKC